LLKNSAILILDEATSALDNVTESRIKDYLAQDSRTTITIAHKLNSIQMCDSIIVMEQGKIIEQGNHKQLIEKQGVYSQLCNLS